MGKTAWAFIKRDCLLMLSYRMAFFGQVLFIFLGVSVFYYVGRVFDGAKNPMLASYGGNYFAFLLIGVALTDFLKVSLSTFNMSIRENQMMGTLEMMLLSPIRVTSFLIYSSLWSYIFASIRFLVYLLIACLLYGFDLHNANLFGALVILVLSVGCFSAFGILTAAFVMVFKKGDASTVMSAASILLGGVMFPAEMLPGWLKPVSNLLPVTHSLKAMRQALIAGEGLSVLAPEMLALILFSAVLFPIGMLAFSWSVQRTKITGSLGQY